MHLKGNSLRDFQELLEEDLFVDYFNKYLCLPIFPLCIAVTKRKPLEILMYPKLENKDTLNDEGLYTYLWKQKFLNFVKTRFYIEYLMAKEMLLADTIDVSHFEFQKSDVSLTHRLVLENAVYWLKDQCLGRVSAVKKFRNFLYDIPHAFRFFQYWIDIEFIYRRILYQPEMFLYEFEELKMKYFYSNGVLAFPQHLLDAAHAILEHNLLASMGSRIYDVCFAFCLQRLCLKRLSDYWLIHYLIIEEISVDNPLERMDYNLALHFLRGGDCDELRGLLEAYTESHLDEEENAFDFDVRRRSSVLCDLHRSDTPISDRLKMVDASFRRSNIINRSRDNSIDHVTSDLASMVPTKRRCRDVIINDDNTMPLDQIMEKYNKKKENRRVVDPEYEALSTKFSETGVVVKEAASDWHLYLPMIREIKAAEEAAKKKREMENARHPTSPKPKFKPTKGRYDDMEVDDLLLGASAHNFMRLYKLRMMQDTKSSNSSESLIRSKNMVAFKKQATYHPNDDVDHKSTAAHRKGSRSRFMKTSEVALQRSEMIREANARRAELIERFMAEKNVVTKSNKLTRMSYSLSVGVTLGSSVHDINQQPNHKVITVTRNPLSVAKSKMVTLQMRKLDKNTKKYQAKPKPKPKSRGVYIPSPVRMEINQSKSDDESDSYDSDEDREYREEVENKRVIAALQTDEAALHPFETFLIDFCEEEQPLILFRFWRDVEQLRYQYRFCIRSFPYYQATMRAISLRYLHKTSMKKITALQYPSELSEKMLSMKRIRLPKDLIKLQMEALEYLKPYFYAYWQQEMQIFYLKAVDITSIPEEIKVNESTSKDEDTSKCEITPKYSRVPDIKEKFSKQPTIDEYDYEFEHAYYGDEEYDADECTSKDGGNLSIAEGLNKKSKDKKSGIKIDTKWCKVRRNSSRKNKRQRKGDKHTSHKVKPSVSENSESLKRRLEQESHRGLSKMDKKFERLKRLSTDEKQSHESLGEQEKNSILSLADKVTKGRERDLPLVETRDVPNPKLDPRMPSFIITMYQQYSPVYTAQEISRLANFSGSVIDPSHPSQLLKNVKTRNDDVIENEEAKLTEESVYGSSSPARNKVKIISSKKEKGNSIATVPPGVKSLPAIKDKPAKTASRMSQQVKINYFKRLQNGRALKKILDEEEQKELAEKYPPIFTDKRSNKIKLVSMKENIPAKYHRLPTFSPERLKRIAKPSSSQLTAEEKKVLRRVDRAYDLVLDSYFATTDNTTMKRGKSTDGKMSDHEGLVPLPPVQPKMKLLPQTADERVALAMEAAQEYPKLEMKETATAFSVQVSPSSANIPQIPEPRLDIVAWSKYAMFLKGRRPFTRPSCFNDILHDEAHFQFFRRFLKSHHANKPLEFWKAVETLKTVTKTSAKKTTTFEIVRKYFQPPKGQSECALASLKSSSTVLKEIPNSTKVTEEMLTLAQEAVEKGLREKWFVKYLGIFAADISSAISITHLGRESGKRSRKKRVHMNISSQARDVFQKFFRRAARFVISMRNKHKAHEFRNFLRRKAGETEEELREMRCKSALTGRTDMVSRRSKSNLDVTKTKIGGTTIISDTRLEKRELNCKQRIIGGELVNYGLLPNDFDLWIEIDCYQRNSDIAIKDDSSIRWIMRKSRLIYFNFLNSSVAPPLRVNVPYEVADKVRRSLNIGVIWRSIFHEATLYLFPVLLHFWKEYCDEKYSYTNIKSLYITKKLKTRSKRSGSGYALPIFSLTNLFNRRPVHEARKKLAEQEAEEAKRQQRQQELCNIRNKDMERRMINTFRDDDPETRINFSLSGGAVVINTLLKRGSLKIGGGRHFNTGSVATKERELKLKVSSLTNNKKLQFDTDCDRKNPEENPDAPVDDDEFMARFTKIFRKDSAIIRY